MIPVFSDEKDRTEYIDKFLKGFGAQNVIKQVKPKDRLEGLDAKDRLEGLDAKDRLKGLNAKDRLEGLDLNDLLDGLSKKDRQKLKNILLDT